MSSLVAELMKTLRASDFNISDIKISSNIDVTKTLFDGLIKGCKEIIPLGLRTIIVSENFKNKQANVFYKLVKDNPQLLDAAKKILSVKNK